MNAEKELLLALLVEKYTTKAIIKPAVQLPLPQKRHRKRTKPHRWTHAQKSYLIQQKKAGVENAQIAADLGLRTKQIANMFYGLTQREMGSK